jgi:hypothetical protein
VISFIEHHCPISKRPASYYGVPTLKSRLGDWTPHWTFSWFSSFPSGKCWNSTLNSATIASFHILSNLPFSYHSFIRHYILRVAEKASLNYKKQTWSVSANVHIRRLLNKMLSILRSRLLVYLFRTILLYKIFCDKFGNFRECSIHCKGQQIINILLQNLLNKFWIQSRNLNSRVTLSWAEGINELQIAMHWIKIDTEIKWS